MEGSSRPWWASGPHNRVIGLMLAMIVIVTLVATPVDNSFRGLAALAVEGMGILLLGTLLWRANWNLNRESVTRFLRTGANLPVLLLLILASISCALSPHLIYSAQELLRLGVGVLLYFAVGYQFRRSEHLARLVNTLIFVAIATSLMGMAQYSSTTSQQAAGLFGDHQIFGSFLMVLLPVVAVIAVTERHAKRQLAAQVATVLLTTSLLLTHARSAWIGATCGIIVLVALAIATGLRKGNVDAKKHQLVLPAMLLVISVGFFMLLWPQTSSIIGRASSLSSLDTVDTYNVRKNTWQGGLKMIGERPLTGFGLGLYPYYQGAYTHAGFPVSVLGGRTSLGEQAHNFYLQTAAELGIPGLLLMVSVLVAFLATGLRKVWHMDAGIRRNLLIGSMAAVVAASVDAFASPSWQLPQVSMFLWLMMGLGTACVRPHSRHHQEVKEAPVQTRYSRPLAIMGALGFALLLPTIQVAAANLYKKPKGIICTPTNSTIHSNGSPNYQIYTVFAQYTDGSAYDVSEDNTPGVYLTTYTQSGGAGSMVVVAHTHRKYQSVPNEVDNPVITITFQQWAQNSQEFSGGPYTVTATLHVAH